MFICLVIIICHIPLTVLVCVFGTNTSSGTYLAFGPAQFPGYPIGLPASHSLGLVVAARGEFNHPGSIILRIVYLSAVYMRVFGINILYRYLLGFLALSAFGLQPTSSKGSVLASRSLHAPHDR